MKARWHVLVRSLPATLVASIGCAAAPRVAPASAGTLVIVGGGPRVDDSRGTNP